MELSTIFIIVLAIGALVAFSIFMYLLYTYDDSEIKYSKRDKDDDDQDDDDDDDDLNTIVANAATIIITTIT